MIKFPCAFFTIVFFLFTAISGAQAEENKMRFYQCPAIPDDEKAMVTLAEDLFDKGVKLSVEKRFELALTYFLCSASMVEHINTTFNIAQAARFMKNKQRLCFVFRRFIDKHPDTATSASLEKLIAVINKKSARSD